MELKSIKKEEKAVSKWFLPLSIAIICITTASLYHKSVKNDFLDLDDMSIIVRNYNFLKDFSNAGQAFKQGAFKVQGEKDTLTSYYRPIMIVSFMIDAHLSPAKSKYPVPAPFIKANILYHILACILLLLLLYELETPPLPSLLLTLIFSAHPLLNQAIAWIPGRNDSLLAIFIISSFTFIVRYLKTKKDWLLIFHIVFFIFALFTKENALMLVPVVFLYLQFVQKERIPLKTLTALVTAYIACIIPWLLMRHNALITNADRSTLSDIIKTMFVNSPFFIQYLSKSILPFNLSVMSAAADTDYVTGFLAIGLLLVAIAWSKMENRRFVMFGIAWFLLFLAPSFFSSFSGLEHRAYLPLIGLIVSTSRLGIIKTADLNNKSIKSRLGFGILISVFFLFFYLTSKRLSIFENRYTFDQSAIETAPHASLPCIYLATHYDEERMFDKAIAAYTEALRRDSNCDLTYLNLAGDYLRTNNYREAEKTLQADISRHPSNSVAVFNLGLVVFQYEHKDSEGVSLWKKSISLDSGFARPYKVLSQYYQAIGDSINTVLYRNLYVRKSHN